MKLSAEQTKTFLRIQRKHNVSVPFLLHNMPAIIKFVQYAITPHVVLKRKLIRKRNRVFLLHNYLRKLIFDPSKLKKRQSVKRLHSQWSKRLVIYLRRSKMVEFFEDEIAAEGKLPEEVVSKQLKEQLELLKSGKRTVPFFQDNNNADDQRDVALSARCVSLDEIEPEAGTEAATFTNETDLEEISEQPEEESLLMTVIDIIEDASKSSISETTCPNEPKSAKRLSSGSDRPNGNFLDMLISKVKNTTDNVSETVAIVEKSMEPPKQPVKPISVDVENDERENSNSSSDFFGFDDNERIRGTFPGMLSTPLVQKRDFNSAFESETLNAYMRDNSLESSAIVNFPQRRPEDGLVHANAIPPKLDMPALPEGLQSLRTVAERRTFLQRTRNVKYCVINNVGTIFRELQKQIKGHRINRHAVEAVQASSTVPLTRQGWKAATWLLTDEGNYYFQTITIDGKNFRLFGCRGNSQKKFKRPHTSRCEKISSSCTDDCMDRIIFRALRPIRTIERRSKLSDAAMKVVYKACPLSQKILHRSQDDEPVFGSLEIVRMPQVELEVFPQLQKPLNDIAKRYLQLILPYNGISREWAEFSVSTLVEREKMDLALNQKQSFTFPLPYTNDRDHLLVRRVYNRSEAFEGHFDNSNLSFRKEIDQKKADGIESPDTLVEECADVLTDMLNSVAISCSENSFIKDDPDNIYLHGNGDDEVMVEKSAKKTVELHQHQAGHQNKKQSRLLMELKRLNATIIDAAVPKSEEDGSTCDKESCRLGCVCASLNEGNTVRQHCGKQRCILECNCRCPSIMRLETDGRTITTEDAFMLRRQATAKLARMEKEFTSTIVLTGSETLLINESQYDKKRRCTKIPKRYGDFVDPDDSDFNETKPSKRIDTPALQNFPLEPIMVKDSIYQCLRHCTVNVKRLRDIKDLAPWCLTHMVYNCYCKGQATVGSPIVLEKQEGHNEGLTTDEGVKSRTLYSFDKEESKMNEEMSSSYETDYSESDNDSKSSLSLGNKRGRPKHDKRGRMPDNDIVESYMNAKANHCRRVVPIPRNTFLRRNRKRVAHVQLFIEENETDETRLSLNEHVLRSVYYHKNNQSQNRQSGVALKSNEHIKVEERKHQVKEKNRRSKQRSDTSIADKSNLSEESNARIDEAPSAKKRRMSIVDLEEGSSLLRFNRYKDPKSREIPLIFVRDSSPSTLSSSSNHTPLPQEQITVPKISQIFSLNANAVEMGTDTAAAVAADIPQQSTEAAASAEGVSSEAFKNVFQVVIKNMNNLVSKKMQDIDMALRRESKAIPAPNDEILCIIRWNNFLEAFMDGFVYLWEVRTVNMTFIAATIRNIMPLVVNALSVVNIRALPRNGLPLMGRMLIDKMRNGITDGLAVVMQGQKMYWFVKGFLRPDKTRVCPKPTPETHPLLTKKINILCRLLINQQINEHKKRQETALQMRSPSQHSRSPSNAVHRQPEISPLRVAPNNIPPKLKVLPMQRNISDHATLILEQMVTQAYGILRTNIVFRKLRQNEIREIFQPASMNSDHHWLVLDLSNDFSHIFVPELRDLLTLDRIQKVMSYAVTKSRIVKLQFCQKSLFNAYVTPMSRRKLYFGPFRNTVITPKLILLQSVDGQMMLREVYESRHNVATKTDKTTAFWLVQKRGKLFLDVEEETPIRILQEDVTEIQDDIQEIIDDDDSVVSNVVSELQSTSQYQDRLAEIRKDVEKSNKPNEEDDDCMIIEDIPVTSTPTRSATPERINYTISYTGENSSLVVIQNESEQVSGTAQNSVHNNFTILTSEVEPTLVSTSEAMQRQINNPQQHLHQPFKPLNPIVHMTPDDPEPTQIPANIIMKSSVDSFQPLAMPPDIILSVPTNNFNAAPVTTSEDVILLPSLPITPAVTESNMPEPIASGNENVEKAANPPIETEPAISEPETNLSKLTAASIKWNKNITIKKVLVDSEQNPSPSPVPTINPQQIVPTLLRKPVTVTSTTTGKIMLHNQIGQKVRLNYLPNTTPVIKTVPTKQPLAKAKFQVPQSLRQAIQYPSHTLQKPKTSSPQSVPQTQQSPQKSSTPPNQPSTQRPVVQKLGSPIFTHRPTLNAARPTTSPQGVLTVRTPTAINTLIKSQQQQQLIRNPGTNSISGISLLRPAQPSMRPRAPTPVSSSARMPTIISPPMVTFKNSSPSVFVKNSSNSAVNLNIAKPSNSPHQTQFKRSLNQSIGESVMRVKTQNLLNAQKLIPTMKQPLLSCDSPQIIDPLQISEESSDTATSNLPQLRLPNDMKTVKITPNATQTKASVTPLTPSTSSDVGGSGVKRNSTGGIVNSPTARLQPIRFQNSSTPPATSRKTVTVVTTVNKSPATQLSQVKGIPIELPRLKKFAIISSANTTVITPPTSKQSVEATAEEEVEQSTLSNISATDNTFSPIQKRKIISSDLITCTSSMTSSLSPAVISKGLVKVPEFISPDASATSTDVLSNTSNSVPEYGYFHANIDGLPKFVVKRVNDDYLIKVPNFNGILKLTGLTTVHNYLNQYSIEKCGKTEEDVLHFKWIFRAQDRTKLSNINKLNSSLMRPSNASPTVQKLLSAPRNITTSTPPAKVGNILKPIVVSIKKPDTIDPIVLVDDE